MGRTLHFEVRRADSGKITEKEKEAMYEISLKYNSGKYKNVWTCENFFLDAYEYRPNWSRYDRNSTRGAEASWEYIHKMEQRLTKELGSRSKAIKKMVKNHDVNLYRDENTSVGGFCKVQGNEYNAFLVYQALLEITMKCKNLVIDVSDEGRFLLCDLRLKNGKAQPRLEEMLDAIKYYCARALLARKELSKYSALDEIKIPDGLCDELQKDFFLDNPYGEDHSVEYINEKLADLKIIQDVIRKHCDYPLFVFNIMSYYFDASLFARKLNPDDFKDYKMSMTTLMAGFGGEYWNLRDYDAEKESYKALSFGQSLINAGNAVGRDLSMQVLGVDEPLEARNAE